MTDDCRIYGSDRDETLFAVVDPVDYQWALQWRWSPKWSRGGTKVYLRRVAHEGTRVCRVQRTVWLHREIVIVRMGIVPPTPEHTMVDHEDGDEMNCRRINLRWATPSMNAKNVRFNGAAFKRRMGL